MTVYIGIDPGLTGAVAVITDEGVEVFDTPTVKVKREEYLEAEMVDTIRGIQSACPPPAFAVIEGQQAMPGQGLSSALRLGLGWGLWRMALSALSIPYEHVTPAKWKRNMGIPGGADKDASRLMAQQLFPTLVSELKRKKDHGRADAVLLAEWLRRQREGGL
jgi:crossover junction endodeoxyribonuclease RuvC